MKRIDELGERALTALAARLSDRGVIVLAVLLYGGLGLALPLTLAWPKLWRVLANLFGTSLAGLLVVARLAVIVVAARRRHLVEWTTSLRLLTAQEFEWLVGEVFQREGWRVRETGQQQAPDGNIDLELTRGGERTIVQCKRWTSSLVGVDEIRKFGGTLLREGLAGKAGTFVTLSDFTEAARAEAKKSEIVLVDGRELYGRVEQVRRPELCTLCAAPMVLGHSSHGWWLRCVASSGCTGKRDLGNEPGRAVDLLTLPP